MSEPRVRPLARRSFRRGEGPCVGGRLRAPWDLGAGEEADDV